MVILRSQICNIPKVSGIFWPFSFHGHRYNQQVGSSKLFKRYLLKAFFLWFLTSILYSVQLKVLRPGNLIVSFTVLLIMMRKIVAQALF